MKNLRLLFIAAIVLAIGMASTRGELSVGQKSGSGEFPLMNGQEAAGIYYDAQEAVVVGIAAELLADDVERVTGTRPLVSTGVPSTDAPAVLLGTLGKSRIIDEMVEQGRVATDGLEGQWESFQVSTAKNDAGTLRLVLLGSDRRGTAYAAMEISRAIGVSPWYWWADVAVPQQRALFIGAGSVREGEPSVKYRGIFINDEGWSLQPWAAKTFETELGDIGPRTYEKIFELMLRLRLNYIWPAMHPCTKAFNIYPENKEVAERFGIVMGSSHCEQMLRNNVTEWKGSGPGIRLRTTTTS